MMNSKAVLFEATTDQRLHFFSKLVPVLALFGYQSVFITNDLALYWQARRSGLRVYLIWDVKGQESVLYSDISASINQVTGWLTPEETKRLYVSTYHLIETLHKKYNFELLCTGFGWLVSEFALRDFANNNNIDKLFFEITNLPNRIVVDPQGSNATSMLYSCPQILEEFPVEESAYESWRDNYLAERLRNNNLAQAKILSTSNKKVQRLKRVFLFLLHKMLGITGNIKPSLEIGNIRKSKTPSFDFPFDLVDFEQEQGSYLFFPLQVSNDTQVIFNSDGTVIDALMQAITLAEEKGLQLFVKPHPAESNMAVLSEVMRIKQYANFRFINGNTLEIIQNAKEVVTINSTVGLEAMILGKPVTFLGRSFYSKFDARYLRNYILGYAIEADYFGDTPITKNAVERMLQNSKIRAKELTSV